MENGTMTRITFDPNRRTDLLEAELGALTDAEVESLLTLMEECELAAVRCHDRDSEDYYAEQVDQLHVELRGRRMAARDRRSTEQTIISAIALREMNRQSVLAAMIVGSMLGRAR
jgi:hypothetical protein